MSQKRLFKAVVVVTSVLAVFGASCSTDDREASFKVFIEDTEIVPIEQDSLSTVSDIAGLQRPTESAVDDKGLPLVTVEYQKMAISKLKDFVDQDGILGELSLQEKECVVESLTLSLPDTALAHVSSLSSSELQQGIPTLHIPTMDITSSSDNAIHCADWDSIFYKALMARTGHPIPDFMMDCYTRVLANSTLLREIVEVVIFDIPDEKNLRVYTMTRECDIELVASQLYQAFFARDIDEETSNCGVSYILSTIERDDLIRVLQDETSSSLVDDYLNTYDIIEKDTNNTNARSSDG